MHPEFGLDPSLLLTVEESAILLRLGRTQTYELIMRGKIQSVKIGRRRLVVRNGLENYVAGLLGEQGEG
jgi:excisionase family DNA binding protein